MIEEGRVERRRVPRPRRLDGRGGEGRVGELGLTGHRARRRRKKSEGGRGESGGKKSGDWLEKDSSDSSSVDGGRVKDRGGRLRGGPVGVQAPGSKGLEMLHRDAVRAAIENRYRDEHGLRRLKEEARTVD